MSDRAPEILVHIAAPARAVDDVDYRTLARSYLDFEAGTRTAIFSGRGRLGDANHQDGRDIDQHSEDAGRNLPLSSTEGLVIDTPDISFQSAFGNMASPRLRQVREDRVTDSQSSWVAPPSVIQDSLPENNVTLPQFCSPTRILEHYIAGFDSSQSESSPILERKLVQAGNSGENTSHRSSQLARGAGSDWDVEVPDMQPSDLTAFLGTRNTSVPSSPALPGQPGEDEHPGQDAGSITGTVIPLSPAISNKRPLPVTSEPTSFIEETRIVSSYPSQRRNAPPSRAGSEPPAKKARVSSTSPNGKPLERSASDIGPRQEQAKAKKKKDTRKLDHLEITTPPPATSLQDLQPADMITETLASLASQLSLKRRYRPQSQTRDLRPFERGYWLLDCRSWDKTLKDDAWEFLTDYLRQCDVGWGITCRRDRAFTWIRLYCWGCVVGHMYLVLWLASKRQAKHIGMSWIAGDGKPVIITGGRPASR